MSNHAVGPPVESHPPTGANAHPAAAGGSRRTAGLVAGVGILLMAALAGYGNFAAVQGLVTDGDAAATARDIAASPGTFRAGVAALYAVVVLDVLVAWALFRVFQPVHEGLSRLAAWFRLTYAAVFLVALAQLADIPGLLAAKTSGAPGAFTPPQVDAMALAKVEDFNDIWTAGLLLFGAAPARAGLPGLPLAGAAARVGRPGRHRRRRLRVRHPRRRPLERVTVRGLHRHLRR